MAKLAPGCKRQKIVIRRKGGKVVTTFMGHKGKGCGPRPKPKTGHLRHFKSGMRTAAKHCKGRPRNAFLNCISTQMGTYSGRRAR